MPTGTIDWRGGWVGTSTTGYTGTSTITYYAMDAVYYDGAFFKVTGTVASDISGFTGGTAGRYIVIVNNTDKNQTFNEESTSSAIFNRIQLGVANKTIGINQTATFIYVTGLIVASATGQSRWILTATT